jgi:signal transduction histidine kinase
MKSKNRHRGILLLMIISQLLLTGFVFQWLSSQYRLERSRLKEELVQIYLESHDEMLDTILYRHVVEPALSDTSITHTEIAIRKGAAKLPRAVYAVGLQGDTCQVKNQKQAFVTLRMDGVTDSTLKNGIPEGNIKKTDFLLRTVRLFISSKKDSSGTWNQMADSFPLSIDTSLFRSNYIHHISGTGKKFRITWTSQEAGINDRQSHTSLYISPLSDTDLPRAEVKGFQSYVLGNIFPQILFGFILVIITAIAFYAAYRNIRNQLILNEIRNEFISNMTHELKTPVSTMKVALESLLNYDMRKDPGVTDEYLKLASEETRRLESLINRVLDQTFLEGNEVPLTLIETDVKMLVESAVKIMTPRLNNSGTISFTPEQQNIIIKGDELYLQGLLLNLLDNSIRYCDKVPEIVITAKTTDKNVEIEVSDNGPGIPDQYIKRIFDKFFRVPAGNLHNIKGYGLGLSYAALVMRLHKGNISVRNNSTGCSFVLKFPVS